MNSKQIPAKEIEFLKAAARYLERPSLLVRITDLIGKPIALGMELLPAAVKKSISNATQAALEKALNLSISTIPSGTIGSFDLGVRNSYWTDWLHTGMTVVSGAAGGFFGLAALPIELPITTCLMLRSISSIADDFGHDLTSVKIRLECLAVLALGSPSGLDDEIDTAYFTSRVAMARFIDDTAKWLAKKSGQEVAQAIAEKSAPALIQFIAKVAARFEVVIAEKAMVEALPVIGAVTGAAINAALTDHFNAVARFHFGIRALEAKYGVQEIRELYGACRA